MDSMEDINAEKKIAVQKLRLLIQQEMQQNKASQGILSIAAFGLALGVVFGLLILILGLWNIQTGFGSDFLRLFESLHPNGKLSVLREDGRKWIGLIIVILYSFLDGVIIGSMIAFFNNFFHSLLFISSRKKGSAKDLKKKAA